MTTADCGNAHEASAVNKVDDYVALLVLGSGLCEPASSRPIHLDAPDPTLELGRRVGAGVRAVAVEHEADLTGRPAVIACGDLAHDGMGEGRATNLLDEGAKGAEDDVFEEEPDRQDEDCVRARKSVYLPTGISLIISKLSTKLLGLQR